MPDPVFLAASSDAVNLGANDASSGTIHFATVNVGDLVLVDVQREAYSEITGVTLGSQAMTALGTPHDSNAGTGFATQVWACIATADGAGSNVSATASFSGVRGWLSMTGARYGNVASATPLQIACAYTGCSDRAAADTNIQTLQITTSQRALIVVLGTTYNDYHTLTAQNSYTKRVDNTTYGGSPQTVQFILDKVANAGNFGGGSETIATITASDQELGHIIAFEPAPETYQYAYPSTDTTRTNWEENDGTTDDLKGRIDEVTPDDADFIRTGLAPSSAIYVSKFGSLNDPQSSTGYQVSVRYGKDAAGGDVNSLLVQLRQGYASEGSPGTLIATVLNNANISEGWTQADYDLSGAEADSITNHSDLYLRLVGNRESGSSIELVGVGAFAANTSNSITPALPAGVQENDLILVLIAAGGDSPQTTCSSPPSGYALRGNELWWDYGAGGGYQAVYWKVAGASEGNPTFGMTCETGNGGGLWAATIVFRGVDTSDPFCQSAISQASVTSAATTMTPADVTTQADNAMVVSFASSTDNNALGLNSGNEQGFTLSGISGSGYHSTAGSDGSLGVAYKLVPSAGTVTPPTWEQTVNGSDFWNYQTVSLRPAAASRRTQVSWARFRTPLAAAQALDAQPGSVALSGVAMSPLAARHVNAAPGAIAISGVAATFEKLKQIEASPGAVSLSGVAATLEVARIMPALAGALALDASPATLARSLFVNAEAGAVTAGAIAAGMLAARVIGAAPGAYALTGADAALIRHGAISAAPGAVVLSGFDAAFEKAKQIVAAPGALTVNGVDAGFARSRVLDAAPGALALTGIDATVGVLGALVLDAAPGALALAGSDAGLVRSLALDAQAGAVGVTGVAAGLLSARALEAVPGAVALAGVDASLSAVGVFELDAQPGSVAVSGVQAALRAARALPALPGALTLSGAPAALAWARQVGAQPGALTLTGSPAVAERVMGAQPGALALTGVPATLTKAGQVALDCQPGSISINGAPATVLPQRALAALAGSVTVDTTAAWFLATRVLDAQPAAVAAVGFPAALVIPSTFELDAEPGAIAVEPAGAALEATRKRGDVSVFAAFTPEEIRRVHAQFIKEISGEAVNRTEASLTLIDAVWGEHQGWVLGGLHVVGIVGAATNRSGAWGALEGAVAMRGVATSYQEAHADLTGARAIVGDAVVGTRATWEGVAVQDDENALRAVIAAVVGAYVMDEPERKSGD